MQDLLRSQGFDFLRLQSLGSAKFVFFQWGTPDLEGFLWGFRGSKGFFGALGFGTLGMLRLALGVTLPQTNMETHIAPF